MTAKKLPIVQRVAVSDIDAGIEIWRDDSYPRLIRRIRKAERRGEVSILRIAKQQNKYGQWGARVKRLRLPTPRRFHLDPIAVFLIGWGVVVLVTAIGAFIWGYRS